MNLPADGKLTKVRRISHCLGSGYPWDLQSFEIRFELAVPIQK